MGRIRHFNDLILRATTIVLLLVFAASPCSGQESTASISDVAAPSQVDEQIAAGQFAFEFSCLDCHDAERALAKRKSLAAWVGTVRRMAAKDGAQISSSDIEPIARYLASLNEPETSSDNSSQVGANVGAAVPEGVSIFSTVSLLHRSGAVDDLENGGFMPEVWLGADWQSRGPLSARVQMCVTCHSENSTGSRIELAEGILRLDVDKLLGVEEGCGPQVKIDAGRFIVPFGAFAAKSHPGAYRTATRPLIYNMGQNIYATDIGPPLLPMPYADEGVLLSVQREISCDQMATLDVYAVSGLQGFNSLDLSGFWQSRDYVDNNAEPATGGRITIGNRYLRGGASLTTGRFNQNGTFGSGLEHLDYKIYGADVIARIDDLFRFTAEYARRTNDSFDSTDGVVGEDIHGYVIEGELRVYDEPRIGLTVRYDEQRRTDGLPISGSAISSAQFSVRRISWGFNFALAGSGMLIINHERWLMPDEIGDSDVLGIRWVAAF